MQNIKDAVECVLEFINEIPLSNATIGRYKFHYWHSIVPYCEAERIEFFSDDIMQDYIEVLMSKVEDGKICIDYVRQQRKAAVLLADCMHGRKLVLGQRVYGKVKLPDYFEKILNDYAMYISQSLSSGTVKNHISYIRQFLVFLENCDTRDFSELTSDNVKEFISITAPNHKGSMSILVGTVKKFVSYLIDSGFTTINADCYLTRPAPRRKKLFPCFTDDEASAIIDCIDRSTPIGKRNYAIMVTALWTGLRSTDILGLKRTDIDWRHKAVVVLQDKTKMYIQMELPTIVGNAISDYILCGRPETDNPHIFLRHKCPYIELSSSGGRNVLRRYLNESGISHKAWDGKSFHAFRRTFGTRLVRAGVPIRLVGEMLGHMNLDSTKRYVALDKEGLRICCLDISKFKTRKAGLI